MPRNRQDIPREERVRELLEVAHRLFLERGYAATSIADIARAAGLASNSVYWYFPTKDHAFAAALDRVLADEAVEHASAGQGPAGRLFAVLDCLEDYRPLVPVIHERVPHAPAVAEFHDRAHRFFEQLFLDAVEQRLPPGEDRQLAVAALAATLEGALGHAGSAHSFADLVRFVLDRVTSGQPSPA
jgi:TetR/AcrR family transcriptional repressor of mexAB-oprM operon